MPAARETLLEAAHMASGTQPWPGVRMVDVATAAGVSRQTLYNEFGTKEGLGAALVDRVVHSALEGALRAAEEAAGGSTDPADACSAAAAWMLRAARDEPIVRAALTGCWGASMPLPAAAEGAPCGLRRGEPGELTAVLCERLIDGLSPNGFSGRLGAACEVGLRVALSFVIAPAAKESDEEAVAQVRDVVRALLVHLR